jgi:hypothetical protein
LTDRSHFLFGTLAGMAGLTSTDGRIARGERARTAALDAAVVLATESGVVVRPALHSSRGLRRLWAMHERRLADVASGALPGGCFFCNAQFEFAARPGVVHDRLATALGAWHVLLERLITESMALGELRPDTDPAQLAFELNAHETAAIYESRLLPASQVYTYARTAAIVRLRGLSPTPELLPEA